MKRNLPSSHSLFAFEAAARHRNFSRAAEELDISQPAVSRAVSLLETQVGEKLFVRSGPRIRLTEHGAQLGALMSDSFSGIEKLVSSWRDSKSNRVPILLSISSSMAAHWLIPRLFEFREAFPNVDLRFELIAGGIGHGPVQADLGLRRFPANLPADNAAYYLEEIIQPVAAFDYVNRMGTLDRPRSKRPHTLITLSDHWCDWETFARMAKITLPAGYKTMTFSDYSVAMQSAINGQGILLGWLSVTSRLLRNRSLLAASNAGIETGATYKLVSQAEPENGPIVEQVKNWMCGEIQKDIAEMRLRSPRHAREAEIILPKI